jgi:16S rRNA (uracil1498-N3)-methyltransferase
MQFFYHKNAGEETLKIDSDLHKYIFKVRRHNIEDNLYFRNLKDKYIYLYKVSNINRRETSLFLESCEEKTIEPSKKLHIGWCIIDPKTVEKTIASLNEIGVSKITFIYCLYSQKQFKINFEKLNKIVYNSSSQCGRSDIIKFNTCENLDKFLEQNPQSYMFNFSINNIADKRNDIDTIVLGCEGGFSSNEIEIFSKEKTVGINSNIILRSETAIISIASHILQV